MLDRHDFVAPGTICKRCGQPLTRGYIAITEAGEDAYGSTCARAVFGTVSGCPDLTIHAAASPTGTGGSTVSQGGNLPVAPSDARSALRYILLRQELLPGYGARVARHPTLARLLAAYRANGVLTKEDVDLVVEFEARQHRKERLKNLLDVHAAHHLLTQRIAAKPPSVMEEGIRRSLHDFLALTPAQMAFLDLGMPLTAFR